MNVLLINPPFMLSEDSPYSKTGAILPSLGLLYIAAFLRREQPEINIQILDAPANRINFQKFRERLKDFCPDIVGMSIYTTTFLAALEAAKNVKEIFPNCLVVGGGAHASVLPEECLASPYIDLIVVGEGEEIFKDLVECIIAGNSVKVIPNIFYKEGSTILRTQTKLTTLDLEKLPFPARDLVDMHLYRPAYGTFKRSPATNMITSRGCPFNCSFCSKSIFGSHYRMLSASKTLQEIEMLIREFGIKEIIFNDDVFTCNQKRIENLCDLLIERSTDITWSCSTRVNLVNPNLLDKMKKSGCVSIGYGIETGDPEILKNVHKGFSLEKAKEAISWTKNAGIETRSYYVLGFPGETKVTLQRTLEIALELDTDFVIFNIAIPLPGTLMYEEAKLKGLLLFDGVELYKRTDGPHPLIKLRDITEEELIQFYRNAYKKYYLRPGYVLRQIKNISSVNDIKRYFEGLLSFLNWKVHFYHKLILNKVKRIFSQSAT